MEEYNLIFKVSLVIVIYLITWLLVKVGKLKLITHRRIWNILLLITFLISCLLGLLATFLIDQGNIPIWYIKILRLHVNAGIFMTVIGLFHIFWHVKYFKLIFNKKK